MLTAATIAAVHDSRRRAALPLTSVRSWKTKAERNQLVQDIQAAVADLSVVVEIDDHPRDVTLILHGQGLHADIWIGIDEQPTDVPIISWFKAMRPLVAVEGAWVEAEINSVHRLKATSLPTTFEELVGALRTGFIACNDGSAFVPAVAEVAQ